MPVHYYARDLSNGGKGELHFFHSPDIRDKWVKQDTNRQKLYRDQADRIYGAKIVNDIISKCPQHWKEQ